MDVFFYCSLIWAHSPLKLKRVTQPKAAMNPMKRPSNRVKMPKKQTQPKKVAFMYRLNSALFIMMAKTLKQNEPESKWNVSENELWSELNWILIEFLKTCFILTTNPNPLLRVTHWCQLNAKTLFTVTNEYFILWTFSHFLIDNSNNNFWLT